MRRAALILALLAAVVLPASASAASWANPQIKIAVKSGLMGPSVAHFQPKGPLTRRALGQIVAGITHKAQVVENPTQGVTVAELDRALVQALGMSGAARHVRTVLRGQKLQPPTRAGYEVVARLLELRTNHPAGSDNLELLPTQVANRAEAAWSVARILQLSSWDLQWENSRAMAFQLPALTTWKRRVLTRAVRFIGYPYVWGGTSEHSEAPFGVRAPGGFDCSGFAWRVYKTQPYSGAAKLGTTIHGRTTYDMSGEIARTKRVKRSHLLPGDLVFFGDRGTRSKPSEVGHMGIYMGKGWFIHSSGQGVTLMPLDGWYSDTFAWGRRPLREAGLS
ncbi:MAG TPA: C40 family peptidase [Gaiellaceae bacterium]|jgi:cell wall-associated NlpC family hydrolase